MILLKFILAFSLLFLSGNSILNRFNYHPSLLERISLSGIIGMGLGTFELILIEFIGLPIVYLNFALTALILLIVLNISNPFNFQYALNFSSGVKEAPFRSYEIYFILGIVILLIASAWRCYYNPIAPYDSKVGIDLVAKYAVKESVLASSVFMEFPKIHDLGNQPIYAPFAMLMQTMFRLIGFSFGKVWLSLFYLSFLTFLYSRIRKVIHPYLAGLLMAFFIFIPELYSYSFLIQTDFSNALFFAIGVFFFYEFYKKQKNKLLWLSTLFMAFACWTRTETIFFLPFGGLILLWNYYSSLKDYRVWIKVALFGIIPFTTIIIWNFLFVKAWIPADPETLSKINFDFTNYLSRMASNIGEMNNTVLYKETYWNYGLWGSLILAGISMIGFKSLKGTMYLLWCLIIYFTFVLLLMHVQDVNVEYTFRRGAFKFFPLFIFFLAHSRLFEKLSSAISEWEYQ